jgi:N-acetylmuramic acid 6-phosphate (MurNAc-6-P) etherase
MARKTQPINSQNETFRDLMVRMSALESQHPQRYFILNPIIGPEPITGSSRMKSGTTTKIMLDLVLTRALGHGEKDLGMMLKWYEDVLNEVVYAEESLKTLGELVDKAANSLRTQGSVNYLADSERLGFLACVDASECVPTYGANKEDIKGL